MNMNAAQCSEEWQVLVSASVDDDLTPEEQTALDAHLAVCEACVRLKEQHTRFWRNVRAAVASCSAELRVTRIWSPRRPAGRN